MTISCSRDFFIEALQSFKERIVSSRIMLILTCIVCVMFLKFTESNSLIDGIAIVHKVNTASIVILLLVFYFAAELLIFLTALLLSKKEKRNNNRAIFRYLFSSYWIIFFVYAGFLQYLTNKFVLRGSGVLQLIFVLVVPCLLIIFIFGLSWFNIVKSNDKLSRISKFSPAIVLLISIAFYFTVGPIELSFRYLEQSKISITPTSTLNCIELKKDTIIQQLLHYPDDTTCFEIMLVIHNTNDDAYLFNSKNFKVQIIPIDMDESFFLYPESYNIDSLIIISGHSALPLSMWEFCCTTLLKKFIIGYTYPYTYEFIMIAPLTQTHIRSFAGKFLITAKDKNEDQ